MKVDNMNLREYYAGQALIGLIAEPIEGVQKALFVSIDKECAEKFARAAFLLADAMLKMRAPDE